MAYYLRSIEVKLRQYLGLFPAVAVLGPRQTGKTTLLRHVLGETHSYISFDDLFYVEWFNRDPEGFFEQFNGPVILDEVQRCPSIFLYLKRKIDEKRFDYGYWVLTGSSQFDVIRSISETLAGRIGYLNLLPFDSLEVPSEMLESHFLNGGYPELILRGYEGVREWYGSYIQTYLERDVRSLMKIENLRDFQRCMLLLAGRVGQELNMSTLASEIGVTVHTIKSWISILEASFILFLMPPYFCNVSKRLIKRPKLYFYDSGLVAYLTGHRTKEQVEQGPMSGAFFENYVVSEIKKMQLHCDKDWSMYFYREQQGVEVDLVLEDHEQGVLELVEIKHTFTAKPLMWSGLQKLSDKLNKPNTAAYVLYKGPIKRLPQVTFMTLSDFLAEKRGR